MTVRENLEKVQEFFEDHEWVQGGMFKTEKGFANPVELLVMMMPPKVTGACLEGACYHTMPKGSLDAVEAIQRAAWKLKPQWQNQPLWLINDDPSTSREDAMLFIKHAIAEEENGND